MRKRNHHISVWLNEKELAHLRRQANHAGIKVDPFIRSLIMGTDIRPRPPHEYGALLPGLVVYVLSDSAIVHDLRVTVTMVRLQI